MNPRTLQWIAEACDGQIWQGGPATVVRRICTDSRQVQRDDLFIAIRGDRFDGHDFVEQVARHGAAACLIERDRISSPSPTLPTVTVANSRTALSALAARYRREFSIPIIAVCGSNGKTTTKELLRAVLGEQFPVLASEASFNNDIGVPLTLLRLDSSHRAAVVEVGTNHPGELGPLLACIRPTHGVLTSIGREHLEFFRSLEGVIEEESALLEAVPAEGTLFVPGDTPGLEKVLARVHAHVVRIGWGADCTWRAHSAQVDPGGTRFGVCAPEPALSGPYQLRLLGCHQVTNALLALAVGHALGLNRPALERGLLAARPAAMRLQLWNSPTLRILDDTYNANADSMRAALETLRDLGPAGRRIAVLGDMAELGEHTATAHAEVGEVAARTGVDCLYTVGEQAQVTAASARAAGLSRVAAFRDLPDLTSALAAGVLPGDLILVKASRRNRLERVVDFLKQRATELTQLEGAPLEA